MRLQALLFHTEQYRSPQYTARRPTAFHAAPYSALARRAFGAAAWAWALSGCGLGGPHQRRAVVVFVLAWRGTGSASSVIAAQQIPLFAVRLSPSA